MLTAVPRVAVIGAAARFGDTELQCGSDIFMDADYGRNLDRDEPSLFVWSTASSA
jgi:hypothetical protein